MMSEYLKSKIYRSSNQATQAKPQLWVWTSQQYARSRQNLMGLTLFMLISITAYSFKDFNLFEAASEPVRQLLGYPPSAYLISIALAVYCFSAAIITFTSMASNAPPASSWKHLGYRSAFYMFYGFSGSISGHFIPVLLIGISLYALDQSHIWLYNCKSVQEQKEPLG